MKDLELQQSLHPEGVINISHPHEQLNRVLFSLGINKSAFVSATQEEQLAILIDRCGFQLPDPQPCTEAELFPEQGLVVVKPELFRDSAKVIDYLLAIDINVISARSFIYSPQQYWGIYGRKFIEHFDQVPHGALLLLISITSPSVMVTFEHKTADQYREFYSREHLLPCCEDAISDDPQRVFDYLFIRKGTSSLRQTLCRPLAIARGFADMTNLVDIDYWDFSSYFRHRPPDKNLAAFNGIHSPNNCNELKYNLDVLSK